MYKNEPIKMLEHIRLFCENKNTISLNEKNISECAAYIRYVPRHAIISELEKMLMTDVAGDCFRKLHELSVLKYIIPQLDKCFYTPQHNKFHIYNVGEHIMHAVDNTPKILVIRWAALLHDVGKPYCSSTDSSGTIHFYGHHTESVKIANEFMFKYSFDSEMRKEVCILIEYHDVHFEQTEIGVKKALSRLGETVFLKLLDLQEADVSAKNPSYISDKRITLDRLRELCMDIIKKGEPYRYTDLAIGKRDLIKIKFHAEHQMNDVIKILFDEVVSNPKLNNREYLLKRARILKNNY